MPERLGLTFVGADNQEHRPYVIHRAPLGTHERFVAFLIEHFAGAFPTWLAPIQVRVLTVGERFTEYGRRLVDELRGDLVRAGARRQRPHGGQEGAERRDPEDPQRPRGRGAGAGRTAP